MELVEYLKENMVLIPKGQEIIRDFVDPVKWMSSDYKMSIPGTKKEKIVKKEVVIVQAFCLSKIPVTNELYHYVMEMDCDIQMKDYPVVNISWIDAIKFCNKLSEKFSLEKCYTLDEASEKIAFDDSKNGFRLPKEVEWQYACRGNTEGYRYGNIEDIAWFEENSEKSLHQVKTKQENNFGLFDMIGNVWEWCFDLYDEERYGNYRIFRGGSFASEKRACGATSRRKSFPEFRIDDLGFRIAKNNLEGLE